MKNNERKIAKLLLQSNAIKLNIANPFVWSSGWKSPIYCDNRVILSYPEIRNIIKQQFSDIIRNEFPNVEVIAGVATGAIAMGALIADLLDKPFIYVRTSAKDHGLSKLVEGHIEKEQKVVIVEDLISTGSSSLKVVEVLRNEGCDILGMVAIFTYGFQVATDSFSKNNCRLITLSNYDALIEQAIEDGYILPEYLDILREWRKDPENWNP